MRSHLAAISIRQHGRATAKRRDDTLPSSATLRRVLAGHLCSGCGACAVIAPNKVEMEMAQPGFLRPRQRMPFSNAQERALAEVCPGSTVKRAAGAPAGDELWGPIVAVREGWASDAALRHAASSGGALSAILSYLLDARAIDAVLQTAAAPELAIGNTSVVSTTGADVKRAAGSRYAPSAPLAPLGPLLDTNRRYAFVGKPCDVAALRALSRFDARIEQRIVVTLSFFCAGVPSLRGARSLLDRMGVAEHSVTAFRYRGEGWPGRATARLPDGSLRQLTYQESWGEVLSREVQARCKICPDGTGGFADIVCADAWKTDASGYPVLEEADGISLIVTRTDLGERIVSNALTAGAVVAQRSTVEAIAPMQPGQVKKRRAALARLMALRVSGRATPAYAGFRLAANARRAGIAMNVREFASTLRRVVLGRL